MKNILYFIPMEAKNQLALTSKPSDSMLHDLGLDHLINNIQSYCGVLHGPDDKQGVLCSLLLWEGIKYGPDIELRKINDKFYIGKHKDHEWPSEKELRREEVKLGFTTEVLLSDGSLWRIPVAKSFPRKIVLGPDGPEYQIIDKYRKFHERCIKIFEGSSNDLEYLECMCEALSFSYKISKTEIYLLELLDTNNINNIFDAIFELDKHRQLIEQITEKKD